HVTEVLSGDYYQTLSTGSPHQMWSAAMVISPVLRGMLGLETDSIRKTLVFAPHVENVPGFAVENVKVCDDSFFLLFTRKTSVEDGRSPEGIELEIQRRSGVEDCTVEFQPAISSRTGVLKVELNGKTIPFRIERHTTDQHVSMSLPIKESQNTVRVWLTRDFG